MSKFRAPTLGVTKLAAQKAAKVLALELDGLSEHDVKQAFRAIAFDAHPDTSSDETGVGPAEARIAAGTPTLDELTKARATLIKWLHGLPEAKCPVCKGGGYVIVPARFKISKPCPLCGGGK